MTAFDIRRPVALHVTGHYHKDKRTGRLLAAFRSVLVRRALLFKLRIDPQQELTDSAIETEWRSRVNRNPKERRRIRRAKGELRLVTTQRKGNP